MLEFMLITEGTSDQAVLESILAGYYGEEPIINSRRPSLYDATDEFREEAREKRYGGWGKVLEHCKHSDLLREDLQYNDYLIVQIDTDCARYFGVDCSKDRTEESIIEATCLALRNFFEEDFYNVFQDKLLFAISVHSIECWLLPLYAREDEDRKRVKACADLLETHVERKISSKDKICRHQRELIMPGRKNNYRKEYDFYLCISENYRKKDNIEQARKHNKSLDIFLSSLPQADA